MINFVCRICGANEYYSIDTGFECVQCSVYFRYIEKFSLPTIKFKRIHENAKYPFKANPGDTGFDVYAIEKTIIPSFKLVLVRTGLCFGFPENVDCQIRPRSGLAKHLLIPNSPATIDNAYKGELKIRLFNFTDTDYTIEIEDRIAQIVFTTAHQYNIVENNDIGISERGTGGFGSSGR